MDRARPIRMCSGEARCPSTAREDRPSIGLILIQRTGRSGSGTKLRSSAECSSQRCNTRTLRTVDQLKKAEFEVNSAYQRALREALEPRSRQPTRRQRRG